MIGAFGLVRLCYLRVKDWRNPGDRDPSLAEELPSSEPSQTPTPGLGLNILKVFSSNFSNDDEKTKVEDDSCTDQDKRGQQEGEEVDELVRGKSTCSRYMISWLPWLVLIQTQETKLGDCESGSGDTPLLEGGQEASKMERSDSCNLSVASSSTLREEYRIV